MRGQNEGVNPSTAIAEVIVDELIAGGVTDAVLSPGSRNAPLSMALHRADRAGRLRLHVRIDERTAGFLALGLARAVGSRRCPVVTTSGTAVANLHPAVVEADLSGVPILVLSADRPPWLRDVGENQTIDQVRLFGTALRFFHEFETSTAVAGQNARWRSMVCRALAAATGAPPRTGAAEPVPGRAAAARRRDPPSPPAGRNRSPAGAVPGRRSTRPGPTVPASRHRRRASGRWWSPTSRTPRRPRLAAAGHLVISEAGGAGGAGVLAAGGHLLAASGVQQGQPPGPGRSCWAGPTLSRPISALLSDPAVHVDVVAPALRWRGANGNVRRLAPTLVPGPAAGARRLVGDCGGRPTPAAAAAVAGVAADESLAASPVLARELVARPRRRHPARRRLVAAGARPRCRRRSRGTASGCSPTAGRPASTARSAPRSAPRSRIPGRRSPTWAT